MAAIPASSLNSIDAAFHDRESGFRAEIAQPQYGRPVRDDCDAVALARERVDFRFVFRDRLRDTTNSRGIHHGQDISRANRKLAPHPNFASKMEKKNAVGRRKHGDIR